MRTAKTLPSLSVLLCSVGLLFGTLACSSNSGGGGSAGSGGTGGSAGSGGTRGSNTGGSGTAGTGGSGGSGGSSGTGGDSGTGGSSASGGSSGAGGDNQADAGNAGGSGGDNGGADAAEPDASVGTADGPSGGGVDAGASDGPPAIPPPANTTKIAQHVLTWYSFQDNTPVNSLFTSSGKTGLKPYSSVAVPFRELKDFGGFLSYGDKIWVSFLAGRTMPNGMKHSGWVQVDDYCGDAMDDSYCFQQINGTGTMYPNVDLYIGDFSKSGYKPTPPTPAAPMGDCVGPGGSGQDLTDVYTGKPATFQANYGGATLGTGKCGDRQTARDQQFGPPASAPFGDEASMDPTKKVGTTNACWGYDGQGPDTDKACADCVAGVSCAP